MLMLLCNGQLVLTFVGVIVCGTSIYVRSFLQQNKTFSILIILNVSLTTQTICVAQQSILVFVSTRVSMCQRELKVILVSVWGRAQAEELQTLSGWG